MALINKDNTLFLGPDFYNLRPKSFTKDILDFETTDCWYCEFFYGESLKFLYDKAILSDDALNRFRNNECLFILNNAHEAFHNVVEPIYDICVNQLRIPPKQIVLISESATINLEVERVATKYNLEKINTKWMRIFELGATRVQHDPTLETLTYKEYPKKYLNFNRRWRLHRPTLVALLKINGLADMGHISLAKADDNKDWNMFFEDIKWSFKDKPELLNTLLSNEQLVKTLPELKLDQDDMTFNHAQTLDSAADYLYQSSYFSVVSETNFFKEYGEGVFVSEKIFRPIVKKHPFIIVSRPYTLSTMKQIGYMTFSDIINEDYDNEPDDCKRLNMIVNEINRLCNLSGQELSEFLSRAKEIAQYNYNTLFSKREFITDL